MARFPNNFGNGLTSQPLGYATPADEMTISTFFNAVYAWMAAGLALTGVIAFIVANRPDLLPFQLTGGTFLILFVLQLLLVVSISGAINRIGPAAATALFLLYAALNGVTFSVLFKAYSLPSLTSAFLVTAGTFGAMSIYGYTTRRDLTRFGSLFFAALIGIVIASVVNMFLHSPMLYWLVSYGGVILFIGLTAYDTQVLKIYAAQTAGNPHMASRLAIVGSLRLYLDFINLFLFILRIMGNRRN
jgi:FtsH-binding integral membrane protein